MRTSELAGQAGVNTETLRYYERRGLLIRVLQRMHDSLADLVATGDLPRADRWCALLEAIDHCPEATR